MLRNKKNKKVTMFLLFINQAITVYHLKQQLQKSQFLKLHKYHFRNRLK